MTKNTITKLPNGLIHIKFGEDLSIFSPIARNWLTFMIGHKKGNRILIIGDEIVGVVVWPETWVKILKAVGGNTEGFEAHIS